MKTKDKTKELKSLKDSLKKEKLPAPPPDSDADIKAVDSEGFSTTGKNIDLSTKKKR